MDRPSRAQSGTVQDAGGRIPILTPRPGGIAERFAGRMYGRHPGAVFALALIVGFAVAAVLSILLGLFVTNVLIKTGGIGGADESFVETLAAHRTGTLTDLSAVGSTVGSVVLSALAALVAIYFAFKRRWT